MSAESAVNNVITQLKALSSSATTDAVALVDAANAMLKAAKTPTVSALKFRIVPVDSKYLITPRPPKVATLAPIILPTIGDMQEITQPTEHFTDRTPSLTLPTFTYADISAPDRFNEFAPTPEPLGPAPVVPPLSVVSAPSLTAPLRIDVDAVSGKAPEVPKPVFQEFTADFQSAYSEGLNAVSGGLSEWSVLMHQLRTKLAPIEGALSDQLRTAMDGTETALPDSWESQKYDQARQEINTERRSALLALDRDPASITGVVTGDRVFSRMETELKALQATTQAAGKTTVERREREVKHWQWAVALMAKLVDVALELRAQEIGWQMKGLMIALDGAEATLALALKALALKEKEVAFFTRYNATQLRRAELHMAFEKTKLEPLRMAVENNALIVGHNDNVLQAYQLAGNLVQTKLKVFQSRIDYMTTAAAWEKLKLKSFEADISAYRATLKRVMAEHTALRARIQGDVAKADGELAKVKLYEAELKGQAADIKAQAAKVQAQAAQNKSVLEAYTATTETQLAQFKLLGGVAKSALTALSKGALAEVAEQEMKLRQDELDDRTELNAAIAQLHRDALHTTTLLHDHSLLLEQADAQGSMLMGGSAVVGGIAKQALASLNAIGTKEVKASA